MQVSGQSRVFLFAHSMGAGVVGHGLTRNIIDVAPAGVMLSAGPFLAHRNLMIDAKLARHNRRLSKPHPRST